MIFFQDELNSTSVKLGFSNMPHFVDEVSQSFLDRPYNFFKYTLPFPLFDHITPPPPPQKKKQNKKTNNPEYSVSYVWNQCAL